MSGGFLAVGHVTRDEFEHQPGWRLGGAALYAAATAARLGLRADLVTRVGRSEHDALVQQCAGLGVSLHALPAETTTTFAVRDVDGRRRLRLRARARGIALDDVPPALRDARTVVLASVAHEIDGGLHAALRSARVVVTAQGYLREWSADGTVRRGRWENATEVVRSSTAVVLSEEDVDGDLAEPRRWAAYGCVIVTLAERGALVLAASGETPVPGFAAASVVDRTGAGDVFAAGLAIALVDGRALLDAVRFANAVASFVVEGMGMEALASRGEVERRLRG